ncbi:hypothetical protein [Haloparvum sedimenti]|uniref:hypothetical protein n=1 Tax=Haloparvum sedimenti TaxID=1678448 RepID=UPI00071E6E6A|nr:hypothetical protein [Haloparvum sedimenti]
MLASEGGAALALQPETEGEQTALTRLQAIYRRATQYQLPTPYWDAAANFPDLDSTGEEVLVFRDGMNGTPVDGEATAAARADDAPPDCSENPSPSGGTDETTTDGGTA